MVFYKLLAAAWLAAGLAGCAQGRDPAGGRTDAREARRTPVATLGPDDGLPFTTTPGKTVPEPSNVHVEAPPTAGNVDDRQGNTAAAGR